MFFCRTTWLSPHEKRRFFHGNMGNKLGKSLQMKFFQACFSFRCINPINPRILKGGFGFLWTRKGLKSMVFRRSSRKNPWKQWKNSPSFSCAKKRGYHGDIEGNQKKSMTGWWFEHFFLFSIIYINIWDVILPIDELIYSYFSR